MSQALLIAGNNSRFLDDTYVISSSLKSLGVKVLRTLPTAYIDEGMMTYRLERAIAKKTREPLLLVYTGHGSRIGWELDDDRRLLYTEIATALAFKRRRPVTIINDCCHAMALADELARLKVSPDKTSVIAACAADATTKSGFARSVIEAWSQRQPYRINRWGSEIDAGFFQQAPDTAASTT